MGDYQLAAERFSKARFSPRTYVEPYLPNLVYSAFDVEDFYWTKRLDLFCVVEPGKRALFVDVGHPALNGTQVLADTLATYNIPWNGTEIFLTHLHDDHYGNAAWCLEQGAKAVYSGIVPPPYDQESVQRYLQATGVLEAGDTEFAEHAIFLSGAREDFTIGDQVKQLPAGSAFDIGGYHLEVMATPGHALEHCCLLDREAGILFAGDHVLAGAPAICPLAMDQHLVGTFIENIRYLKTLGLSHILMCHADSPTTPEGVQALLDRNITQFDRPLNKVTAILAQAEKPLSPYQVAQRYYRHLPGGLAQQPPPLRVKRVGNIVGYLDYLAQQGTVQQAADAKGTYRYHLGYRLVSKTH